MRPPTWLRRLFHHPAASPCAIECPACSGTCIDLRQFLPQVREYAICKFHEAVARRGEQAALTDWREQVASNWRPCTFCRGTGRIAVAEPRRRAKGRTRERRR